MGMGSPEQLPQELFIQDDPTSCPTTFDTIQSIKDPFSDLSLFVAKKMKEEIIKTPRGTPLSSHLSSVLLEQLSSEIKRRFPKYTLGNSVLKSAWDKVQYYLRLVSDQRSLWTGNGTLSIPMMVRQNFHNRISTLSLKSASDQFNQAEEVALSISECVAALDHMRPDLAYITRFSYQIGSHFYPKKELLTKSPFEIDAYDRFFTRLILEESHLMLSCEKMVHRIKDLSDAYRKTLSLSMAEMRSSLCILYAEKLYEKCLLRKTIGSHLAKLESFIDEQVQKRSDIDRLIPAFSALFSLCATHHHTLVKAQLESSLKAEQLHPHHILSPYHPLLSRELYSYLQSELSSLKAARISRPLETLIKRLVHLLDKIGQLPKLGKERDEILEMLFWRSFAKFHLKEPVEGEAKNILTSELGRTLVQHPSFSFQEVIRSTSRTLRDLQQLQLEPLIQCDPFAAKNKMSPGEKLYRKLFLLTSQGDLLFKTAYPHPDDFYLKLVAKKWKSMKMDEQNVDHAAFVDILTQNQMKEQPLLRSFKEELEKRIWLSYKCFWYQMLSSGEERSFDRLKKWSFAELTTRNKKEPSMEEVDFFLRQRVPYIPFDSTQDRPQELSGAKRATAPW